MVNLGLYCTGVSSSTVAPYQLAWSQSTREVLAYVFCFQEGMFSTFLQAPCLPEMHRTAKEAMARRGTAADLKLL